MNKEELQLNAITSKTLKEKVIDMLDDIAESKTFYTSLLLLKYIYERDDKAWSIFINEFSKMNFQEQIQVLIDVSGNLKQKKHKEKVKKKNG